MLLRRGSVPKEKTKHSAAVDDFSNISEGATADSLDFLNTNAVAAKTDCNSQNHHDDKVSVENDTDTKIKTVNKDVMVRL